MDEFAFYQAAAAIDSDPHRNDLLKKLKTSCPKLSPGCVVRVLRLYKSDPHRVDAIGKLNFDSLPTAEASQVLNLFNSDPHAVAAANALRGRILFPGACIGPVLQHMKSAAHKTAMVAALTGSGEDEDAVKDGDDMDADYPAKESGFYEFRPSTYHHKAEPPPPPSYDAYEEESVPFVD